MKTKTIFGIFCACIFAVSFVSCSKMEEPVEAENNAAQLVEMTFSAGEDGETKTIIQNGTDIYFQETDAISIINADGNTQFTAKKPSKYEADPWPMPKAEFVGQATVATPYYALYPHTAGAALSDGKITGVVIPAEQAATEATFDPKANASVCKASASKHLHFMNVGAYFEFKTDADYDKVEIISNTTEPIAGTVTVDPATGNVVAYENVVNKVTITNVKAGKTYYAVVLPAAMKNGISVQCFKGTESAGTVVTNASVTTNRAKIKKLGTIKPTPIPPYETIPGDYSISYDEATGKFTKIRFAKGNLQYQASTGTWRFAPGQWVVLGDDTVTGGNTTSSGRDTQEKWIDLFGFGCTGKENGSKYYQPWDSFYASRSTGELYCQKNLSVNDGSDWGYVVSGNKKDYWFTLTGEQWAFLACTTKSGEGVKGRNKYESIAPAHTYAAILVEGIKGTIYFPDGWKDTDWPSDVAQPTQYDHCGSTGTDYQGTYTAAELQKLEDKGIVFFPVTGYRQGTSVISSGVSHSSYTQYVGLYWTSSENTGSGKSAITFGSGDGRNPLSDAVIGSQVPSSVENVRANGQAVRLVMIPKE